MSGHYFIVRKSRGGGGAYNRNIIFVSGVLGQSVYNK